MKRSSKEEFVQKSEAVHGVGKYGYDKFIYIQNKVKGKITCSTHGIFLQCPNVHLKGVGCPKCEFKRRSLAYKSSREEYIAKARLVHGDRFDYSKLKYIDSRSKVKIRCKRHGVFKQKANSHLLGIGCPTCKSSKGELAILAILVKHRIKSIPQYSIPEVCNRLYYDFYLPEKRILIEFHGEQHYQYVPFFHRNGEDDFLAQKNRDALVRYNAKHYKYRYLEFNYLQLNSMTKKQFEELVMLSIF